MISSASHVSNEMPRHCLSQSAAKSDRCWNVTFVTCVYLYVKNSRLCVISASNAKCRVHVCKCMCVYVCVYVQTGLPVQCRIAK
jgi:hypothetical protein